MTARLATALFAALFAAPAAALPLGGFSETRLDHGFRIAETVGEPPSGIRFDLGDLDFLGASAPAALLDAPDAVSVISEQFVAVANQFAEPPLPFEARRRERMGRLGSAADFADAGFDATVLNTGEAGVGSGFFERDVQAVTTAGAGLFDAPFAAEASASFGIERGLILTNTAEAGPNAADTAFNVFAGFDASLIAQASGEGVFARASGGISFLFDGLDPDQLTYIPLDTYFSSTDGDAFETLIVASPGTAGVAFSAAATATGEEGGAQSTVDARHDFILRATLSPGQEAVLTTRFLGANLVEITPRGRADVPLPGAAPLLAAALACAGALLRRSGPRA